MMKNYKNTTGILGSVALCVLVLFSTMQAMAQQAPQSDYEIVEGFKTEHKSLANKTTDVQSVDEAEELISAIKQFKTDYKEHEKLLNKVIYPETFDQKLKELQKSALTTQKRIATIEQQQGKLQQLTSKLTSYDQQLATLNKKTDSLQIAMQKSIKSEKQLSGLVRKYRKNLEQRDDLILSFVDSVMITYQKLDINSMQDLENAQKKARFDADGNALNMIKSIAAENVQFLNSNPQLSTQEYLRMNAVQQQFQDMWNKIGDKFTKIYVDESPTNAKEQVDSSIAKWQEKISSETWASLNKAINQEDIELPKFNDQQTFYNTLNSYLEESFTASKKDRSQKEYSNYQRFYSFWTNEVQTHWSPYIERGNILTSKQLASIDRKVDQWASIAEPESNLMVYLFGGSILALVVLGVILIREKSK